MSPRSIATTSLLPLLVGVTVVVGHHRQIRPWIRIVNNAMGSTELQTSMGWVLGSPALLCTLTVVFGYWLARKDQELRIER